MLDILPTEPYLMVQFYMPAGTNAGVVSMIATYETMPKVVYDYLMEEKDKRDKKLEVLVRGKGQLQDKISEVKDEEAAILAGGLTVIVDNYQSEEIALYELLNP